MKVRCDKEVDAAYIELSAGTPDGGVEIEEGVVVHTTKDHKIICIEILNASHKFPVVSLDALEKAS